MQTNKSNQEIKKGSAGGWLEGGWGVGVVGQVTRQGDRFSRVSRENDVGLAIYRKTL